MTSHQRFSQLKVARSSCLWLVAGCLGIALIGCGQKASHEQASSPPAATPAQPPGQAAGNELAVAEPDSAAPTHPLDLPLTAHWTGDFDELLKHKVIRALVVNSKMEFFYDKGRPRGTAVESLQELETAINQKLGNPNPPIKIAYIPMPLGELKSALDSGIGDIVATAVVISPEREKYVDFTIPYYTGAKKGRGHKYRYAGAQVAGGFERTSGLGESALGGEPGVGVAERIAQEGRQT